MVLLADGILACYNLRGILITESNPPADQIRVGFFEPHEVLVHSRLIVWD
jgi:hypothetical protein